jgi:toxin YoeB
MATQITYKLCPAEPRKDSGDRGSIPGTSHPYAPRTGGHGVDIRWGAAQSGRNSASAPIAKERAATPVSASARAERRRQSRDARGAARGTWRRKRLRAGVKLRRESRSFRTNFARISRTRCGWRAGLLRVLDLVENVMRDRFQGSGKPEPWKHLGANICSRRITQEYRLVYLVAEERIDFLMARYHY